MKNRLNKTQIRPLVATITLALLLFMGNSLELSRAQGGVSSAYPFEGDTTELDNQCVPQMKVFAQSVAEDYRNFLEANFQNKSSTSSLMDTAIAKYREMRDKLMTAYSKYHPHEGSWQLSTGTQPGACLKIIEDNLSDARILLKKHALTTSGVKKSTALLEKYRSINSQLGEMHQQLMLMKSYFDKFAAKLPCYVKSACVKG